ncbi:MAG: 30S ribosomal protein S12 methylthiotransferase RimO, partial [Chloroflexi bacterium]|nr:30S ribosomal protein S12 methylthiotransferase RimO [Chloroflexota bacterium]
MAKSFAIVTLGCPKNTWESEGMAQLLIDSGLTPETDLKAADYLVVNTCGFIGPAKEESIDTVLKLGASKTKRQKLLVTGCLVQRYPEELANEMPEVDGFLGTRVWGEVVNFVRSVGAGERPCWTEAPASEPHVLRNLKQPWAYLKIADGCSAGCSFCAIPIFKGGYRSRPAAE